MCDEAIDRARQSLGSLREGRARLVVSARRAGDRTRVTSWINASVGRLSVISTPDTLANDAALLKAPAETGPPSRVDYHGIPIIWRNGSAAVLLHEAAGHAAEHQRPVIAWADWLSIKDEPPFDVDDEGHATRFADLGRGEAPHSMLRESFTDVPLARMSRVVARQKGERFTTSERRLEIQSLAGGSYDPLTDVVSLFVSAADLVEGSRSVPLLPFAIVETRESIVRAIRSAAGDPIRYPGVVCSREGQELVVESFAPEMLTEFDV